MAKKGSDYASPSRGKRGGRGRGRGGAFATRRKERVVSTDVRPDSAVDDVSDDDEGASQFSFVDPNLTAIAVGSGSGDDEDNIKIEVPVAMWVGPL